MSMKSSLMSEAAADKADYGRVEMKQSGPSLANMDDAPLTNRTVLPLLCPGPLVTVLSLLCIPACCVGSCQVVNVKQEKVLLSLGKYQGTLRKPGCYCVNPMCLVARTISTAQVAVELANVKVADAKGNPLLLSGVVTYKVVDSERAALNVLNHQSFINTQGLTVMKKVASMYPYEAKEGEHSLKSEADVLRVELMSLLQERVDEAGIRVLNFEFNDLAYAPEIAQAMLVRQQAEKVVEARLLIAEGAVEIVKETLKGLTAQNIILNDQEKVRMASNLVVAICSESGATPVMNVST